MFAMAQKQMLDFFEEYNAARAVERRLASDEQMKQPEFTCH